MIGKTKPTPPTQIQMTRQTSPKRKQPQMNAAVNKAQNSARGLRKNKLILFDEFDLAFQIYGILIENGGPYVAHQTRNVVSGGVAAVDDKARMLL